MQTSPRVLILEDNATTRMIISKSLEEQGVDVVVACTLAEAEQHFHDANIDLYLLDVNLPDGDSTSILPKIRLLYPMVPVLIMTADHEHSRISEFFAAGVRDFIRKPIHPLLLASKVLSFIKAYETEKALFEANEVYQRISHEKEQDSVAQVADGNKRVNASGETMARIVSAIERVSNLMEEVSAASKEQASGIDEINQAVLQMDEMTQQNAALVEEAAASADSMRGQAATLRENMARFKLDQNSGSSHFSLPAPKVALAKPKVASKPITDEWEEF